MRTEAPHLPPLDVVREAATALAAELVAERYQVTVQHNGVVEVLNTANLRMSQHLAVMRHGNDWTWHWVWPGVTEKSMPSYQPMVPVHDVAEAARRLVNVLGLVRS